MRNFEAPERSRYNRESGYTAEILSRAATRPTWADVSLATLRQNFRTVQKHVGAAVTVCAVVKADAYGHGAVECSRALEGEGAKWLGVTSLDEAIPLRDAGIRSNILLMTGFWRGEEAEIIRLQLTPTVWELWQIESLDKAAAGLGVSTSGAPESGYWDGRLGVAVEQLPAVLRRAERSQASPSGRTFDASGVFGNYGCAVRRGAGDEISKSRGRWCGKPVSSRASYTWPTPGQ